MLNLKREIPLISNTIIQCSFYGGWDFFRFIIHYAKISRPSVGLCIFSTSLKNLFGFISFAFCGRSNRLVEFINSYS